MSDTLLLWIVPAVIALHNLEEALWLPSWARATGGRWQAGSTRFAFRFAAAILTALVFALATFAQLGGRSSTGYYLLAAFAVGQSINVFVPHLVLTITTRTYAPGLGSGLFLVLPASSVFLIRFFRGADVDLRRFFVILALFVPLVVLSIPVLLRAGRIIENRATRRSAID